MTRLLPRLVVAGTASGVGKTTVTAGLIAALRRRGLVVQPFKCGPDYIDPGYHTLAAGRPCRNLDSWMLNDEQVKDSFVRACRDADVAVVEGVMGLFDGANFDGERASAAQIAKLIGAPVLLVMDISGAARSVAATALGFARFDPDLRVAAVVLNRAGSEGHASGCARAIEHAAGLRVLGFLPRDESLRVPERHLGLLPSGERPAMDALLNEMADSVERHCDIDAILRIAATAGPVVNPPQKRNAVTLAEEPPILAVARDEAFSFYYPDNLELIETAGARIVFFAPAHGESLPPGAAGVYLGGGFPELYARPLSANTALWDDLGALHATGAPILAECGGFMALTEALVDADGVPHRMAGLVPGTTRMTARLAGLGYRHVVAVRDNLLAPAGETLRGHEFHYSVWDCDDCTHDAAWRVRGTRSGAAESDFGYARNGLLASYLHIHLGQSPGLAHRLVAHLRAAAARSADRPPHLVPTGQSCT